jgi:hypothetical protein
MINSILTQAMGMLSFERILCVFTFSLSIWLTYVQMKVARVQFALNQDLLRRLHLVMLQSKICVTKQSLDSVREQHVVTRGKVMDSNDVQLQWINYRDLMLGLISRLEVNESTLQVFVYPKDSDPAIYRGGALTLQPLKRNFNIDTHDFLNHLPAEPGYLVKVVENKANLESTQVGSEMRLVLAPLMSGRAGPYLISKTGNIFEVNFAKKENVPESHNFGFETVNLDGSWPVPTERASA